MNSTVKLDRVYALTGVAAIIIGASVSAFTAKQPSTLAMWASAYLVLVVGVAQIFLASVVAQLMQASSRKLLYQMFALFNAGNILVILSSVLKYSGYENHVMVTTVGAALVIAALGEFGWQLRRAKASQLRTWAYAMIALLIVTALIGIFLAGIH